MAVGILAVPVDAEQIVDALAGVVEVGQRLEQRRDRHRMLDAGLAQQQDHGQHVGRLARHRDDIGAERLRFGAGDDLAGFQHFADIGRGPPAPRNQRSLALQLAQQIGLLGFLRPLRIGAEAIEFGQLVEDLGMTVGILADVELDQLDAEAGEAPDGVLQRPLGDDLHAAFAE